MSDIWKDITLFIPREKQTISIRLDSEILDFFRKSGSGYQGRINSILKSFVAHQKQKDTIKFQKTEIYKINGQQQLHGSTRISGSTHGTVFCLVASLFSVTPILLSNIPFTESIISICNFFDNAGLRISPHLANHTIGLYFEEVQDEYFINCQIKTDLFLAQILSIIPLLDKTKKVYFIPNSTAFNQIRFLSSFQSIIKKFGVTEKLINGSYQFSLKGKYTASNININNYPDSPRTLLTAISILLAVKAKGVSVIKNASFSPNIMTLISFLSDMGAKIEGKGSSELTITGIPKIKGTSFRIDQNNLEATFYALAAASTRSYLRLTDINLDYLEPLFLFLEETGVKIKHGEQEVEIDAATQKLSLPSKKIKIGSFPKFPSDLGLELAVFLSTLDNSYTIEGNLYFSPWSTINELSKFGLQIQIDREQKQIHVNPSKLKSAPANLGEEEGYPLSILLASLVAEGESLIYNVSVLHKKLSETFKKLKKIEAQISHKVEDI